LCDFVVATWNPLGINQCPWRGVQLKRAKAAAISEYSRRDTPYVTSRSQPIGLMLTFHLERHLSLKTSKTTPAPPLYCHH
jgi:hypothetical protein